MDGRQRAVQIQGLSQFRQSPVGLLGYQFPHPAAVTFQNLGFPPAEVPRAATWSNGSSVPLQLEELFDHAN